MQADDLEVNVGTWHGEVKVTGADRSYATVFMDKGTLSIGLK